MESINPSHTQEDEISLRELFDVLWRGKLLILSITAAFTLIAAVAAWVTPKSYKASVVISPVSDTSSSQFGSGLSSLTSQFGGLASLAGISIGGDSKKSESLAVLQSEALTENYIQANHLMQVLYEDKWDPVEKKWRVSDPDKVPTLWKANDYFKKRVRAVTTDTKTGLVTLTITWKDPKLAASWANELVQVTNEYLRTKAINQSERNIIYLNEEAAKTDAVGVKEAIYSILQTEINKQMLARGSDEYAFKVIDPAVPPERAASPKKLIWILVGMFAGLFLSAFVVLIRSAGGPNK